MTQYWRVLACGHAVPKLVVPWPMLLGLVLLALFVLMLVAGFGAPNQAIARLLIGEGFVQFAIGTLSVMRLGTAEILGLGVIFGGLSAAIGTEGWLRVLLSAVGPCWC
jgi:hypothetical protein